MSTLIPVDMYNMIGHCSVDILASEARFALRNITDASDLEVMTLQHGLIQFLSDDLLRLPIHSNEGIVLHSGSEANEVAILLAKRATNRRIVLSTNLSHSSIENSCYKLGMEVVYTEADRQTFQVSADTLNDIIEKYGKDIALLNITYGTTKLGTQQDILFNKETSRLLRKYDIWVHIDAAYGGFMLGLLQDQIPAWKNLSNVRSITVDTHKFVGALGCGVLLLSDYKDKKHLGAEVVYFEGNASSLGTTRSAYPLATALASIKYFGHDGLRQLAQESHNKAVGLAKDIKSMGLNLLVPVETGVVPIHLSDLDEVEYFRAGLIKEGYKISPINIPFRGQNVHGIRVVVTPKKEMTQLTLDGFTKALKKVVLKRGKG